MDVTDLKRLIDANADGEFLTAATFNGHAFGACRVAGASPYWEMHPDTDEFFHVTDGLLELTLLNDSGPQVIQIPAGSVAVVPQGIWHRPAAPDSATFVYFTPGQSLHSDKEDPRV